MPTNAVAPSRGVSGPASDAQVANLSDTGDLTQGPARSLMTRTAGDVSFVTQGGTTIALTAVPAFTVIPIAASRVRATGTTAQVLALY